MVFNQLRRLLSILNNSLGDRSIFFEPAAAKDHFQVHAIAQQLAKSGRQRRALLVKTLMFGTSLIQLELIVIDLNELVFSNCRINKTAGNFQLGEGTKVEAEACGNRRIGGFPQVMGGGQLVKFIC